MKATLKKQRGLSFMGFIGVSVAVIFVAILGMKLVPAYVHSAQITQILTKIANDPAMQGASVKDIKESYNKYANINSISDVTAEDIDIVQEGGQLDLSANYSVKIPLVANVTLLLEFNPSSD